MRATRVGVLALQGAVEAHLATFARLGVEALEVRSATDLEPLTHLVLPGGESTTIRHLLDLFGLGERIAARARAGELALFGVCAGAILLGREPAGPGSERPARLGLLDARVARNAFGPQARSEARELHLAELGLDFRCITIRAPRILDVGPGVRVLGRDGADPILVEAPGLLAATFHPELTDDPRLHARFLELAPAPLAPANSSGALPATLPAKL